MMLLGWLLPLVAVAVAPHNDRQLLKQNIACNSPYSHNKCYKPIILAKSNSVAKDRTNRSFHNKVAWKISWYQPTGTSWSLSYFQPKSHFPHLTMSTPHDRSILSVTDANISPKKSLSSDIKSASTDPSVAGAGENDQVKSMEYHRQVLKGKLEDNSYAFLERKKTLDGRQL